jgi:hypothetical protein
MSEPPESHYVNQPQDFEYVEKLKEEIEIIKKFVELEYYKDLKKIDNRQYEMSLEAEFPAFVKDYPWLFRILLRGDGNHPMLKKMIDGLFSIKNKEVSFDDFQQQLKDELDAKYITTALDAAKSGNVQPKVDKSNNPNVFSIPLSDIMGKN